MEQSAAAVVALTLPPGQAISSRYLGLTLFYPALQVVGLLELAAQVYQLAGLLRFGVQQVFPELFCLALLQEPSVERIKHVRIRFLLECAHTSAGVRLDPPTLDP